MRNKFWKELPSGKPIMDINFPHYDLTPRIESIEAIERSIKKAFGYPKSVYSSLTKKDADMIARMEHEAAIRDAKEREENGEPPLGECCDNCGNEVEEDLHRVKDGLFGREEYLCDACFRKHYGPYKCWKCGELFSENEIDWDHSSREEDSYICKDCAYRHLYSDSSEDDYDDEPASW